MIVLSVLTLLGYRVGVTGNAIAGIVAPLGMAAFGVGLVWFGRRMGRADEDDIAAFLLRAVEATEPPNPVLQADDHLGRSAPSVARR